MALACIGGRCVPCTLDEDCAPGEACAMDHCVPHSAVACRSRWDCDDESLCVLSGYTAGRIRGNEEMRAYCLRPSGGTEQTPADLARQRGTRRPAAGSPSETSGDILQELRAYRESERD